MILKAVLENAIKYNGTPNKGAVVGQLISKDPKIKSKLREITEQIDAAIEQIKGMSLDDKRAKLLELNPKHFDQQDKLKEQRKTQRKEWPPLDGAVDGKVVTRMPPGPSKYPHIGHAISFGINFIYSEKYNGRCILRFDDTNPEVDKQEFVDAIKEDVIDYLGFKPSSIEFASDKISEMHTVAEKLIEDGKAYTCDCQDLKDQRKDMRDCPHRTQSPEQNMDVWDKMKDGMKDTVLRLKIDMGHKNAVMRDPVIFRTVETQHYKQKDSYKLWPTYDFESSFMDGTLGVTHVLRSNEFDSRIELHNHIVDILGLQRTIFKHYSRTNIKDAVIKGREIKKMIDSGDYIGWDDPRLMTLRALRRRGIVKESYRELARTVGLSKAQADLDFSIIAAINRKILDDKAYRFFFIDDPVSITIEGAPSQELELSLHPHHQKGGRKFKTGDTFLLSKQDLDKINDGDLIRLMDCLNFRKQGDRFIFDSLDLEKHKQEGKMIIHWLTEDSVDVEIMTPECTTIKGKAESNISKISIGDVIQFERYAFCRLDSKNKFWYTHK